MTVVGLALALMLAAQPPAAEEEAVALDGVTVTLSKSNSSDFTPEEYAAIQRISGKGPHYSMEQAASFVCSARGRGAASEQIARAAYDATVAFELAKDKFRAGQIDAKAFVEAEKARQKAVALMMTSGNINVPTTSTLEPPRQGSLYIDKLRFRFGRNGGESVLRIYGEIQNRGSKPAYDLPFTLSAVDRFGWILAKYSFARPPVEIPPGGSVPFTATFRHAPQYTSTVRANFGVSTMGRNNRSCDIVQAYKREGQTLDVPRREDSLVTALEDAAAAEAEAGR